MRVDNDAHDTETSRRKDEHRLVAQHDLFARLAGHISPAGALRQNSFSRANAATQDCKSARLPAAVKAPVHCTMWVPGAEFNQALARVPDSAQQSIDLEGEEFGLR
jgi:hypothetical protein